MRCASRARARTSSRPSSRGFARRARATRCPCSSRTTAERLDGSAGRPGGDGRLRVDDHPRPRLDDGPTTMIDRPGDDPDAQEADGVADDAATLEAELAAIEAELAALEAEANVDAEPEADAGSETDV